MKKLLIFTLSCICLAACNYINPEAIKLEIDNRVDVQGKWKITKIAAVLPDGRDSVVTSGLGGLEFGKCNKRDNMTVGCNTGKRIYADGAVEEINFRAYKVQTPRREIEQTMYLGTVSGHGVIDLMGYYDIRKATDKELEIYCENCTAGRTYLKKFTLTAVKE